MGRASDGGRFDWTNGDDDEECDRVHIDFEHRGLPIIDPICAIFLPRRHEVTKKSAARRDAERSTGVAKRRARRRWIADTSTAPDQ